jgi:chitin synthase
MALAILEWFLWLAAFMYCLVKVYQKAEHWNVKVLAVIVAVIFTLLRWELIRSITHSLLIHCR